MPTRSLILRLAVVMLLFAALAAPASASNVFQPAIRTALPSVVRISSIIPARPPLAPAPQLNVTSGVVLDRDGYVATILSSLAGATRPTVMLPDGTKAAATIARSDPNLDVAILKIPSGGLDPIEVAAEPAHVGQWVLTIGNPFGLAQTRTESLSVSVGVISEIGPLSATDFPYTGTLIVSDVIINPGGSGSAMVDLNGKLLGICGKLVTEKNTNAQISVTIPVADVMKLLQEARKLSPPTPTPAPSPTPTPLPAPTPALPTPAKPSESGYLGAYIIDDALGSRGAYVERVVPGSPAEDAGLQQGDLIVAVNDKPVTNGRQFLQLTDAFAVGTRVDLTVRRADADLKISATLAKTPKTVLR